MTQQQPDEINRLIGTFMALQEEWEDQPDAFDWHALDALAREGAQAYNEGAGPSFHALAFNGVPHTELHVRFLQALVAAGFDPFHVEFGAASTGIPVIDHAGLAEAAQSNPASAQMHAALLDLARERFAPLLAGAASSDPETQAGLYRLCEACAESIPSDLLQQVSPELARQREPRRQRRPATPDEGYLSAPESIIDSGTPHG